MNSVESLINISIEQNTDPRELNNFIMRLDVITIRILQKFYQNGLAFPNDTGCYYTQQLHSELNREGFKIELETLRKRLDILVKINLLEKVNTYPRIYIPVKNIEKIQKLIQQVQTFLT